MTSSYVRPNHHKWHDINSTRQLSFSFFSWAVLHFAWVCGSVPLLSGPPDSTLTVRQRSRKMAVIHFVPRHRQGSFSLLPITSRPDSASQQDTAPFPLWPRPTVLQGAEVSGRPTSDSVSATRNLPRHSTPPPGKTATKDGSLGVSQTTGGSGWFSFSLYRINSHYTKNIQHCLLELLHLFWNIPWILIWMDSMAYSSLFLSLFSHVSLSLSLRQFSQRSCKPWIRFNFMLWLRSQK